MKLVHPRADASFEAVVVFTGSVNIRQPSGSIAGERVVYNMRTGQVQGGGQGTNDRVKIRIIPKNQGGG